MLTNFLERKEEKVQLFLLNAENDFLREGLEINFLWHCRKTNQSFTDFTEHKCGLNEANNSTMQFGDEYK